MKTIWKYTLQPDIILEMPAGAEVLSVREQGDEINMWALVDPNAEKEERRFMGFGTGHDVPSAMFKKFIGTAHLQGGSLVFHVFETYL
ncbi:TPA: hypothetical protein QDA90_003485 [Burkholderia vietnamiensis]|uniref:DUF7352 domain-containing protein n=1 Tax=Burkholderia vietnamiensis TaxID=60552 RepID=UPI00298B1763|nr:hypothetical protein [Burkholderia vietnamiensis]